MVTGEQHGHKVKSHKHKRSFDESVRDGNTLIGIIAMSFFLESDNERKEKRRRTEDGKDKKKHKKKDKKKRAK
jgi:hypothetical protein